MKKVITNRKVILLKKGLVESVKTEETFDINFTKFTIESNVRPEPVRLEMCIRSEVDFEIKIPILLDQPFYEGNTELSSEIQESTGNLVTLELLNYEELTLVLSIIEERSIFQ